MTYKTEDYYKLERNLARLTAIKESVDLAREFRAMRYDGDMTISTTPASISPGRSIPLSVFFKRKAVRWLAEEAELRAKTLTEETPEEFDVEIAAQI